MGDGRGCGVQCLRWRGDATLVATRPPSRQDVTGLQRARRARPRHACHALKCARQRAGNGSDGGCTRLSLDGHGRRPWLRCTACDEACRCDACCNAPAIAPRRGWASESAPSTPSARLPRFEVRSSTRRQRQRRRVHSAENRRSRETAVDEVQCCNGVPMRRWLQRARHRAQT